MFFIQTIGLCHRANFRNTTSPYLTSFISGSRDFSKHFFFRSRVLVVTWCLRTYIGLKPYMVNVYIKERINDQITICAGGVTSNTTYLAAFWTMPLAWGLILARRNHSVKASVWNWISHRSVKLYLWTFQRIINA